VFSPAYSSPLLLICPSTFVSQNPANDRQAMGRVWREGQCKRVYVYRLLSTGSIDEKVFQRQLQKEGLNTLVVEQEREGASMDADELRQLLQDIDVDSVSLTHESIRCRRCCLAELPMGMSQEVLHGAAEAADKELADAEEEVAAAAAVSATKAPASGDPCKRVVAEGIPGRSGSGGRCLLETSGGGAPPRRRRKKGLRARIGGDKACARKAVERTVRELLLDSIEGAPTPIPGTVRRQMGKPAEADLRLWAHHWSSSTVSDTVLREAGGEDVTFVFALEVDGREAQLGGAGVGASVGSDSSIAKGGRLASKRRLGGRRRVKRSTRLWVWDTVGSGLVENENVLR
jgi:hypothetical protein